MLLEGSAEDEELTLADVDVLEEANSQPQPSSSQDQLQQQPPDVNIALES